MLDLNEKRTATYLAGSIEQKYDADWLDLDEKRTATANFGFNGRDVRKVRPR